ncbi:hypothetical protein B484DRAFT_425650, partial [Ochromonadaceae sp. CCMP2298]
MCKTKKDIDAGLTDYLISTADEYTDANDNLVPKRYFDGHPDRWRDIQVTHRQRGIVGDPWPGPFVNEPIGNELPNAELVDCSDTLPPPPYRGWDEHATIAWVVQDDLEAGTWIEGYYNKRLTPREASRLETLHDRQERAMQRAMHRLTMQQRINQHRAQLGATAARQKRHTDKHDSAARARAVVVDLAAQAKSDSPQRIRIPEERGRGVISWQAPDTPPRDTGGRAKPSARGHTYGREYLLAHPLPPAAPAPAPAFIRVASTFPSAHHPIQAAPVEERAETEDDEGTEDEEDERDEVHDYITNVTVSHLRATVEGTFGTIRHRFRTLTAAPNAAPSTPFFGARVDRRIC